MNIILGTKVNSSTNFLIEKNNKNIYIAHQQGLNAGFE